MKFKEKFKQNATKAGIISAATGVTYFAMGAIENFVGPGLKDIADCVQSVATTGVPYMMAERCMRGEGDSTIARWGVQMTALAFGIPEIAYDSAQAFNAGPNLLERIKGSEDYLRIAGGAYQPLKDTWDNLKKGY